MSAGRIVRSKGKAQLSPEARHQLRRDLDWEEVESSNVSAMVFVPMTKHPLGGDFLENVEDDFERIGWTLVRFNSGGVYGYAETPECLYRLVRDAVSVGSAVNRLLRPHYEAIRVPI